MSETQGLPDWYLGGGYAHRVVVQPEMLDLTGSNVNLLIYDGTTKKVDENFDVSVDEDGVGTYDIVIAESAMPDTAKEYTYWLWLEYTGDASPLMLQTGRIECIAAQAPSAA